MIKKGQIIKANILGDYAYGIVYGFDKVESKKVIEFTDQHENPRFAFEDQVIDKELIKQCKECQKEVTITVAQRDLNQWEEIDSKAADCFPYLNPEELEVFLSGTCICSECIETFAPEHSNHETEQE